MMNRLEKFDRGLISLPTVHVHKDKIWQNRFLEKHGEETKKKKVNICRFYDIILSFKSIKGEEGGAQIFFNLIHTDYVKGPLRMLRTGGKIREKGTLDLTC